MLGTVFENSKTERSVKPPTKYKVIANNDSTIHIVDHSRCSISKEPFQTLKSDSEIICLSPDGKYLASGALEGPVYLWNVGTGELMSKLPVFLVSLEAVDFSPDGETVAISSYHAINLYRVKTGSIIKTFEAYSTSVCFSPDGQLLAGNDGHQFHVWNVCTGEHVKSFAHHYGEASKVLFSPDGTLLATCNLAKSWIAVWDMHTKKEVFRVESKIAIFSPGGELFTIDSSNDTLRKWNPKTWDCLFVMQDNFFNPSLLPGNRFVTADLSGKGSLDVYDLDCGVALGSINIPKGSYSSICFSNGGTKLALSDGQTITCWNIYPPCIVGTFNVTLELELLHLCRIDDEDHFFAYLSVDDKIKVWDCQTKSEIFSQQKCGVSELSFCNSVQLVVKHVDGTEDKLYWSNPLVVALETDDHQLLEESYGHASFEPETSLIELSCIHNAVRCSRLLAEKGCYNQKSLLKAITKAILGDKKEFVFLLDYLESIDNENEQGKTLLHVAAKSNNLHYTSALLRLGADTSIKDQNGYRADAFACSQEMKDLFDTFDQIILGALQGKSSFVWESNFKDYCRFASRWRNHKDGNTILHMALGSGNLSAIKEVIRFCPDLLSVKNQKGLVPVELLETLPRPSLVTACVFTLALESPMQTLFEQLSWA